MVTQPIFLYNNQLRKKGKNKLGCGKHPFGDEIVEVNLSVYFLINDFFNDWIYISGQPSWEDTSKIHKISNVPVSS